MRKVLSENKGEACVKNLRFCETKYRKFSKPRLVFSQNFIAARKLFCYFFGYKKVD